MIFVDDFMRSSHRRILFLRFCPISMSLSWERIFSPQEVFKAPHGWRHPSIWLRQTQSSHFTPLNINNPPLPLFPSSSLSLWVQHRSLSPSSSLTRRHRRGVVADRCCYYVDKSPSSPIDFVDIFWLFLFFTDWWNVSWIVQFNELYFTSRVMIYCICSKTQKKINLLI